MTIAEHLGKQTKAKLIEEVLRLRRQNGYWKGQLTKAHSTAGRWQGRYYKLQAQHREPYG